MNVARTRITLIFIFALGLGIGLIACLPATPTNGLSAPSPIKGSEAAPSPIKGSEAASSPTRPDDVAFVAATTYYVRTDGGSADQCTGQTDAAYPGSGTGEDCAWDHPFRALPPDGTPRISGGDTLIIASGSYMMGFGASGADNCESDYPWDCHMPPVPSGPDAANPTRILGSGWNSSCSSPPELWGTERSLYILNLTDSSNVEIACLEIIDHSSCVESHSGGLACERDTYPYGDWAPIGLYAEDSANVRLANLNIHGLAYGGIFAGRLTDWIVENVRIAGNGWVGWDGDIEGDDSNSGTLTFRRWTVEWNGCGETYPGGQPTGCWGQTAGGYGDGVGTGATGGHWIIEDSAFLHNTSDGLDLLYAREAGSSIVIRRTIAEGNAGDQLKTTGPTVFENVIAVSNCGFFEGKSFTHNVDPCRAGGSAVALTLRASNHVTIVNSTLTGQGDCLLIAECMEDESCDGSESILLRNDIFLGNPEFGSSDDDTCFAWYGTEHDPFIVDYSIINGTKATPDPCPANSLCNVSPGLVDSRIDNFDAHLLPSSPAIDAGTTEGAPTDDFDETPRDAHPDSGAFEYPPLSAIRSFHSIDPGGIATYTLNVRPIGPSTATINLITVSPSPSLTLQLVPTQVIPPGQAILTATDTHTGTLVPGLRYDIPITSTNGMTQVIHVSLIVGEMQVYLPLILNGLVVSQTQSPPKIAGCAVFPVDNIWNTPVDTLPVHANSAAYVAVIGANTSIHADFGSGTWEGSPIGIPYATVSGTQATVPVTFTYDDESDLGPYPIPPDAPIEGGSDRHVLVVDRDNCILYELFDAWPQPDESWIAGSGAIFNLNSNDLREDGWTSADAAGLPILPGLVCYDEVAEGEIRHAIRFTAEQTRKAYVWPARHDASDLTGAEYPPMGQRFRLRADFDISSFSPKVQVILQALKKYGMMLADNGSDWFIIGAPDERWDNDMLHELDEVYGSDFEAVDVSSLMVHPDSGQAQTP